MIPRSTIYPKISICVCCLLAIWDGVFGQFREPGLVVIAPPDGISQFDTTQLKLSDDGSTLVFQGLSDDFLRTAGAIRFNADTGLQILESADVSGMAKMSRAFDLSVDGSVIIGMGTINGSTAGSLIWTEAGGVQSLNDLAAPPVAPAIALPGGIGGGFVSADGSVMALQIFFESPRFGFYNPGYRFSVEDGAEDLGGVIDGTSGFLIRDISADGGVIVGRGVSTEGNVSVRYTRPGGLEVLPADPRITGDNEILGVSSNGEILFGSYSIPQQVRGLYRYTDADGYEIIEIPNSNFISAEGMSADGKVIYGSVLESGGNRLFRYTGFAGVEFVAGADNHKISDISADGSVFVGFNNSTVEAFRYGSEEGFQTIGEWLTAAGVSVNPNLNFISASHVSASGNVVAGTLIEETSFAFLPYIARGESGAITLAEFSESFGSTASIQQVANLLPSTVLNGSHHRTLLDQPQLNDDNNVWASGDFATDDRRDADLLLGEVGISHDFAPGIRGGIALGQAALWQDLTNGGSQEIDGQYFYGEIAFKVPDLPLILSLSGLYGEYDADITRGYTNAGLPDISRGNTEMNSSSLRLRADWVDMMQVGNLGFSSRIAYTYTHLQTDGYIESGGGFPVDFNSQSHEIHELRIGLTADIDLNDKTSFRVISEGVYRFDDAGSSFGGNVIGLFGFDQPGADTRQAWARLGFEIDHRIDENKAVAASLFGSSRGEDAQLSGGLNFSFGF